MFYSNFVPKTHRFWAISKNVVTLKTGLEVCQSHWKCPHLIERIWLPMTFYSNYGSISCRFWDIPCWKMTWPWNRGQSSLKVIGTETYRSATYDFLLTFHGNHEPISHCFRDRRRFLTIIAKFSHPCVFCAFADGVHPGIGYRCRESKTIMVGLSDGRKGFNIGLAV